jgi:Rad3-related DNA helicase
VTALSPFVALDIQTTGPDLERDSVVAAAAVRFPAGRPGATFHAIVTGPDAAPGTVPRTGRRRSPVETWRGADAAAALRALAVFTAGDVLVGVDLARQLQIARASGALARAVGYDVTALADVLVPTARGLDTEALAALLGVATDQAAAGDGIARARRAGRLALALFDRARGLDADTSARVVALASTATWDLAPLLRLAARHPLHLPPLRARDPVPPPLRRAPTDVPVDTTALDALLAPGGSLSRRLDGFEDRGGQREMLRTVVDAFNRGDELLVEAGTGVGKSLAYLLPAAAWAVANGRPVIVATHTLTLQDQLIGKDLPVVRTLLGGDVRASVLKGRSNYLCRSRLATLAGRIPPDPPAVHAAARIAVWAATTTTGDRAELALRAEEIPTWHLVDAEACAADGCMAAATGECWVHRARARAEGAHVIVVNHALLVSDAMVDHRLLPPHAHVVIDEAHHLEDVATDALAFSASFARVRDAVAGDLDGDHGLLARAAAAAMTSGSDDPIRAAVWETVTALRARCGRAWGEVIDLFDRLAAFLDAGPGGADIRLTDAVRQAPEWLPVEAAWDGLHASIAELRGGLVRLQQAFALSEADLTDGAGLAVDLASASREAHEIDLGLERVIARPSRGDVTWLSRGPRDRVVLHHAPLSVADVLAERLFADKATMVLTSATLRSGGAFDFVRDRTGLPDAPGVVIESPFDYPRTTLVCVPTDMPEPTAPGYQQALDLVLVGLALALGGRALVLYTSHSGLRESYHRIRAPLGVRGISVLGQGLDGAHLALLDRFRREGARAILLGTRSLWEGVDVPGTALSCLVMARLPFDVPTDPVFAARAETYEDPFREYAVPLAVLRFRQGFGRLIRTRADRGVFVVLDGRVRSRSYGHLFLAGLPRCRQYRGPMADLPVVARRFLDGDAMTGDEPVPAAPWADGNDTERWEEQ